MERNLKTIAYAAPLDYIATLDRQLRAAGYDVEFNGAAGTLIAKADDGLVIARALRMGGRDARWSLRADPRAVRPADADTRIANDLANGQGG